MSTRKSGKCALLVAGMVLTSGLWMQADTPTTGPAEAKLTPQELKARIQQMVSSLPNELEQTPTPDQEAKALEGCKLFTSAQTRLAELDQSGKALLGHLGVRSGLCAGDPEIMLAGAKLLWQFRGDKHAHYSANALTWSGLFAGDPKTARQGFDYFLSAAADESWRSWAKRTAPIAAQCGKPVSLRFRLISGPNVSLQKYRGKVVVLHFWASWCGPCMKELPHIKQFYEERKDDKNFTMVSFSLDDNAGSARKVIRDKGMTWPQAMDNSIRRKFVGGGIPHAAVVCPTGNIIWQGHPGNRKTFHWAVDFARRQAARIAERPRSDQPQDPKRNGADPPAAKSPASRPAREAAAQTPQAEADNQYKLALLYSKAGMKEKAKAMFENIIQKYPDTPAAAKAKKALENNP